MKRKYLPFPAVIDSSLVAAWKKCPQKCLLEYFQDWKVKGESVHLHAGKAFAAGVEGARRAYWERQLPPEDAVAEGLRSLILAYGDYECPPESAKSLARMAGALEFYYSTYPLDRDEAVPVTLADGRRGIEFSFAEPIDFTHPESGDPLIYAGRADAVCTYAGATYIVDEKTTGQLGANWANQWQLRSQFTAYCWAAAAIGLPVAGVLVRGIAIYKDRYDSRQALTYRPQFMIDRWYNELLFTLGQMERAWQRYNNGHAEHFLYNLDDSCTAYGGCPFLEVCRSPEPEKWLAQGFEQRHWDPITRTERLAAPPRRVRFDFSFEAEVEGEGALERLQHIAETSPVTAFNDYCEGPFTGKVSEIPSLIPPPEGIDVLVLEPSAESIGQAYSLIDQVIGGSDAK